MGKSIRVDAIDVFRGLTMFFMLWVNSFWSLSDVPHWLKHAARTEDMLGFSDVIFPAFLFIMGASIPFAIQNRLSKGDSLASMLFHILSRSLALIVMGLFTVNFGDDFGSDLTGIGRGNFAMLMVLGFFLVWNVYNKQGVWKKVIFTSMQVAGVILLIYLAYVYRGSDGSTFGVRWWGILGRIGWTYLFCSLIFLVVKNNFKLNIAVLALLIAGALLQGFHIIPTSIFPNNLTIIAYGSSGVLLSLLIERYADKENPQKFYYIMAALGIIMFCAGLLAHNFWIISKIQATPTWYFFCCAICFPLFGLLYYLTDVKGKGWWFNWVRPAGTAALSCYIVAYAWNPIKGLIFSNPLLLPQYSVGILGLINSLCYSLLLVWVVWVLNKYYIKLKV